ncbi:MAG: hypothetical protein D6729_03610 [Deltaproteobacteria bacterium]|nr:MAG: hypothetical protein D6729_03610 [Deltaproteobacteria bacterium]
MTTPIDTLYDEHRTLERMLAALEGMVASIDRGTRIPLETLASVLDFIETFIDGVHHRKEEAHLFPLLEARGLSPAGGPTAVMRAEHARGRELVQEMKAALAELEADPEGEYERFAEAARAFIDLARAHIEKEDEVLFRLAEERLDEATLESLGLGFEEVVSRIGHEAYDRYEKEAEALENVWAE